MQVLTLHGNQIGDAGLSALAEAVGKGALASLVELDLRFNKIGDNGMKALADACASGALDHLKVCWHPIALPPFPKTLHTHSPDP